MVDVEGQQPQQYVPSKTNSRANQLKLTKTETVKSLQDLGVTSAAPVPDINAPQTAKNNIFPEEYTMETPSGLVPVATLQSMGRTASALSRTRTKQLNRTATNSSSTGKEEMEEEETEEREDQSGENELDRSQKIVIERLSLDSTAGESCTPSVVTDTQVTTGLRWSLRKRKAIQKMPYSLERIKHRQLLEGYDISSFDSISNQLTLPKNASTVIHSNDILLTKRTGKPLDEQKDVTIDSIKPENSSVQSQRYDSDEEIPKKRHRTFKDLDQDIVFQSGDSTEDEQDLASTNLQNTQNDEVIFRGRVLNVRTGYRGVLPRVAWEKSLQKQQSSKVTKRKTQLLNHKGVAKRKMNRSAHIEDEEQNLLNDRSSKL